MAAQYFEHLKTVCCEALDLPSCTPSAVCDGVPVCGPCEHCGELHRDVSARGCRCNGKDDGEGQECSLSIIVQQVILQADTLTPSSLLGIVGQSRSVHVEIHAEKHVEILPWHPGQAKQDNSSVKPWPQSGPGELQAQAHPHLASSGEVWLWGSKMTRRVDKEPTLKVDVLDTAEVVLRVVETRSKWSQHRESDVRGEALFVPAFSVTMHSELTLPLQKDGRTCGMIKLSVSRDGWELYLSDPNQEVTIPPEAFVEQVSPMHSPKPVESNTAEATKAEPEGLMESLVYDHDAGNRKPPDRLHAHSSRQPSPKAQQKQQPQQPRPKTALLPQAKGQPADFSTRLSGHPAPLPHPGDLPNTRQPARPPPSSRPPSPPPPASSKPSGYAPMGPAFMLGGGPAGMLGGGPGAMVGAAPVKGPPSSLRGPAVLPQDPNAMIPLPRPP